MLQKLIPKKYNYPKWTLPNKLTFWGLIIGLIAIIISLILEGNPLKKIQFVDSSENSIIERNKAQTYYSFQDYKSMLISSKAAYNEVKSISNLEYLALAYYLNNQYQEASELLKPHIFELSDYGKWLYFINSFPSIDLKDLKEVSAWSNFIKKLEFRSLNPDIIINALMLNLVISENLSELKNDKKIYYTRAKEIINFVNLKLSETGFRCGVELISFTYSDGFIPALETYTKDEFLNLPSIYLDFGFGILMSSNITSEEASLAFKYLNKGFNAKLNWDVRNLVVMTNLLANFLQVVIKSNNTILKKDYFFLLTEMEKSLLAAIESKPILINYSKVTIGLENEDKKNAIINSYRKIGELLKSIPFKKTDIDNYQIIPIIEQRYDILNER